MIGKPLPTAANQEDADADAQAMRKQKDKTTKEEIAKKKLEFMKVNFEVMRKFNGVFFVHQTKSYQRPYLYSKTSLFCLSDTNRLRYGFVWLATWWGFDAFITLAIVLNSFLLASTDYEIRLNPDHLSGWTPIQEQIDFVFSIIFIIECFVKIVAMGFVLHKKAYLRDSWNKLDFFIVSISIIGMLPGGGADSLKALRTFRILRPLRSINKVPDMRKQISALLGSIPGLTRVFFFIIFIFCIFAIFGTNQFLGQQYQFCRATEELEINDDTGKLYWPKLGDDGDGPVLCAEDVDCAFAFPDAEIAICGTVYEKAGLDPIEYDDIRNIELIMYGIPGFDNVGQGFLTIFQVLTLESWVYLMYNYTDTGSGIISVIFFVMVVLLGAFFTMNLVLAIIVDSFSNFAEREEKTKLLQDAENEDIEQDQEHEVDGDKADPDAEFKDEAKAKADDKEITQKQNEELAKPYVEELANDLQDFDEEQFEKEARTRSQRNGLYKVTFDLVTSVSFNFFIFLLIIGNTMTLAVYCFDQSQLQEDVLALFNEFFTWIFFLEMVMKIIGLGFTNYKQDSYNVFDAVIVCISLIDWALSRIPGLNAGSALNAFRALRLLRMMKLSKSWKALRILLGAMSRSLKKIANFGVLLLLFMFIFALLGMELFANITLYDEDENLVVGAEAVQELYLSGRFYAEPRDNFNNVGMALTTVFILLIGEDWNWTMYQWVRAYGSESSMAYYISVFYFVILMIMGNIVLFSVFTAILLEQFENPDEEDDEEEEEEEEEVTEGLRQQLTLSQKVMSKDTWVTAANEFKLAFGKKLRLAKTLPEQEEPEVSIEMADKAADKKSNDQSEDPFGDSESVISQGVFDKAKATPEEIRAREEKLLAREKRQFKKKQLLSKPSILVHYQISGTMLSRKSTTMSSVEEEKLKPLIRHSLFCLGPNNGFRWLVYKFIMNKWFDRIILTLIIISTMTLALETPLDDPNGQKVTILAKIDLFMTAVFTFEASVKIIAWGFALAGPPSYIREPWNILDFVIVVSALLGVIAGDAIQISFIKALRILKILRPLRLIAKDKNLKVAIVSLGRSLPNIMRLQVIVLFFIFLFAILQTTILSGQFFYCETGHLSLQAKQVDQNLVNMWNCLDYGGEWVEPDLNFDTTMNSMLTLVTIQTTEGWIDVMWSSVDAVGPYLSPQVDSNLFMIPYTMILIIIICMLFIELFVGVVTETFNAQKVIMSGNSSLERSQFLFAEVQLMCLRYAPKIKQVKEGKSWLRYNMIIMTEHNYFDAFIMFCIIGNTFILGFNWYMQPENYDLPILIINYIFMFIFTVEAIMKIIAARLAYFKEAWNKFDFTVVFFTIVILILNWTGVGESVAIFGTILRTLRIGRVFRLIKKQPKLQEIFSTLLSATPAMASLGMLLMLLIFMFSIIGMSQFSLVDLDGAGEMNKHVNFQSFGASFLTLLRCSTGEAWNTIMFDSSRPYSILFQCEQDESFEAIVAADRDPTAIDGPKGCGTGFAVAFHLLFQVIVSQVFLNLFIAIIIDAFFGQTDLTQMPVQDIVIEEFQKSWSFFDPDATGFITVDQLDDLIFHIAKADKQGVGKLLGDWGQKMAVDTEDKSGDLALRRKKAKDFRNRQIMALEIPTFNNMKNVMFYDVLISLSQQTVKVYLERDELKAMQRKLKTIKMLKGQAFCDDTLGALQDTIPGHLKSETEFLEFVEMLRQKVPKADIVQELKEFNKKLDAIYSHSVDTNMKFMGEKNHFQSGIPVELSTTNHMGSAMFIYEIIVQAIDRKANSSGLTNRHDGLENLDNHLKSIEEVSARNEITAKHDDTRKKTDFSHAVAEKQEKEIVVQEVDVEVVSESLASPVLLPNEQQVAPFVVVPEAVAVVQREVIDEEEAEDESEIPDQDWRNLK